MSKKVFFVLLVPALVLAGTVSHTFSFAAADLTFDKVAGYDVVALRGGTHTTEIGRPMLPQKAVYLLVPSDAEVTGVKVAVTDSVVLAGTYAVHPHQRPITTNEMAAGVAERRELVQVPTADVYPGTVMGTYAPGLKSGYRICSVMLYPVQYERAMNDDRGTMNEKGRLVLYCGMRVEVTYRSGARAHTLTETQRITFIRDVSLLVANPENAAAFGPAIRTSDGVEVDYLIVTGQDFAGDFQTFCDWKTNKGFRTEVRTISWIAGLYPGRDLQEKIRNCVVDFYQNRGLKYLLLAGDVAIVPDRHVAAIVPGEPPDLPCDLYFGDLDSDWDSNGNDIFGEADDDIDLLSDIYVGRVAIDNRNDVNTFTNKVLTWERNPDPTRLGTMLLPSGWLWQEYNYHGQIVNDAIASYTPGEWEKASLVDPAGSDPARESLNVGFEFSHPAGHGNQQGIYSQNGTPLWVASDAARQTNGFRRLCIMNSMACDPGDIDYNDCVAEIGTNNPNGGLIAAIMNARYGWGTPPGMGPSELLDLSFYNFVFNYDSTDLGIEHARSKDAYRAEAYSDPWMRYCVYELNLLGDPQLPIWHGAPRQLLVTGGDTVRTGGDTLHLVVREGVAPVANALVCARKGNEVYARGRTNGAGVLDLSVCAATPGNMTLFVSAPGYLTCEGTTTVIIGAPMAYVSYDGYLVDDAGQTNPNRVLEPGETARLFVTIRNTGTLGATGVRGSLRARNSFVTVSDSLADYGTLAAGGSGQGDGFVLTVHGNAPQNVFLDFELAVVADQGSWTLSFSAYNGYCGLSVATIDSCAGLLSVSAMGALGYDRRPATSGRGFKWSRSDTSNLYYGSFMFSGLPFEVADNYYGQPTGATLSDWRLSDSLRFVIPLWGGTQQVTGAYTDAGATSPHDIRVRQNAFTLNREGYDRFVILIYDITNAGSTPMTQSYAGLACDFDVHASDKLHDQARADIASATAYMWNALGQSPTVGIRLLSTDPPSNATVIDPFRYRFPDSAMTKGMKYRLLNGDIRLAATERSADWAVAVATGPFELGPGSTRQIAFVIAGGADSAAFLASCDSAQSWYHRFVGIRELTLKPQAQVGLWLAIAPNPFSDQALVSYSLRKECDVVLRLYDVNGGLVRTLVQGRQKVGWSSFVVPRMAFARGVYFLRLDAGTESAVVKVLLVEK